MQNVKQTHTIFDCQILIAIKIQMKCHESNLSHVYNGCVQAKQLVYSPSNDWWFLLLDSINFNRWASIC